jgi:hypothetical protein
LARITAAYEKLPEDQQENKYPNFDTQVVLELKKQLMSKYGNANAKQEFEY